MTKIDPFPEPQGPPWRTLIEELGACADRVGSASLQGAAALMRQAATRLAVLEGALRLQRNSPEIPEGSPASSEWCPRCGAHETNPHWSGCDAEPTPAQDAETEKHARGMDEAGYTWSGAFVRDQARRLREAEKLRDGWRGSASIYASDLVAERTAHAATKAKLAEAEAGRVNDREYVATVQDALARVTAERDEQERLHTKTISECARLRAEVERLRGLDGGTRRVLCPECGLSIGGVDEDGCCSSCGASCLVEGYYWPDDSPEEIARALETTRKAESSLRGKGGRFRVQAEDCGHSDSGAASSIWETSGGTDRRVLELTFSEENDINAPRLVTLLNSAAALEEELRAAHEREENLCKALMEVRWSIGLVECSRKARAREEAK